MPYLSMFDLLKRWTRPPKGRGVFTRQGVYKLVHRPDFPAPAITDGAGRMKLWHVADIAAFESVRPELTDDEAKHRKVRGYAIANLKKAKRGT